MEVEMLGGAMLRNWFYAVAVIIFLLLMISKAFAFWLPPILDLPPFLMEPPHIEGGCHPAMEQIKKDMEESSSRYTKDEDGNTVWLS